MNNFDFFTAAFLIAGASLVALMAYLIFFAGDEHDDQA